MSASRSAIEFQERCGRKVLQSGPRPRFSTDHLKVTGVPLDPPQPGQEFLLANEGETSADRGQTKPWPHQQQGE